MDKQDRIICFQTFYDPMLAHIIRARLEASGIDCFISDENTIGANPLYNQAIGGIKLNIFEHDIEKVQAILADDSNLTDEN